MQNSDRRYAQRIAVELPTQITTRGGRVLNVHTWDFSDKGAYVAMTEEEAGSIDLGSYVTIQLTGTNYETPSLSAEVIRKTERGIALKLELEDEDFPENGDRDSGLL
ncbi:PilZ domain-containing protein [Reinekea marinisedimentorum]|uniref:PilZ domain-containing protein n=1 Tax=Reinekea marinisedimentorum TaxID=230495 RepID=A0A4R3I5T0_9GAMM|nr:PilZ domain-containing protein [Reinekea marinisedimentorum]TCS40339.1 PilZ domain-containing protein [Reinekea marinisedimentorum]